MNKITIGKPLLKLQSVNSTNAYAADLLRNGSAVDGTVILAGYQTQGRGQGGNTWVSETGCNLLFSIILRPGFLMAERQFYLSMCSSIAIDRYIAVPGKATCIKWPNDILLNQKKVAGILIENTILGQNLYSTVIGIGLNVNQRVFPPGLSNPTSISLEAGRDVDLSNTFAGLLESLNAQINKLYSGKFAEIKTCYLNRLWRLNEWAAYTDSSGSFEGRIVDVADSGELIIVRRSGAIKQYGFKEVIFV